MRRLRVRTVVTAIVASLVLAPAAYAASAKKGSPRNQVTSTTTTTSRATTTTSTSVAPTTTTARTTTTAPTPTASTAPAPLELTVRLNGLGRATVTVAGDAVGSVRLTGSPVTVRMPVFATPSDVVGVSPDLGSLATVESWSWSAGTPGMTTRGNRILASGGQQFIPHGLNKNSLESSSTGWYLAGSQFEGMRTWGANTVRVQLGQQFWLTDSCRYDPTYATRVDDVVNKITARGMVALLDLHWSTKGTPCAVAPGQHMMPDTMSLTFWQQVAARYKNNPLVAFDLYNEPYGITPDVWRDGGSMGTWQAVGMQQLYDAVRATGATNLVFVSGIQYAYDIRAAITNPLDGYGIVYAPHIYCLPCNGALPIDIDLVIPPVATTYPVVVTEFGTDDASGTYNANLIDWAERRDIGWLAYTWAASDPTQFALLTDWTSMQPNVAGQPVWRGLQSHLAS